MARLRNYPIRIVKALGFNAAIREIDDVIESNKMKDTLILGEVENVGCVILVGNYEDARALGNEYTGWCICDYKESWDKYSSREKGLVQLIVFDATKTEDESRSMLGLTFRINDSFHKLDYMYGFYGKDIPIEDTVAKEKAKDVAENAVRRCGGFTLDDLYNFIKK